MIYVVLTGYGTRGPDNAMTAFDYSAFWSRSGIMSLIGEPDGPPMPCRPGQGDHATSLNLLSGTLAALRLRDMTDEGQFVEVTLQRTGAWTIGADVSASLILEDQPQRINRVLPGNPMFNSYETADSRWLMLVMPTGDRYWIPFCRAVGQAAWMEDERYLTLMGRMEHTAELTGAIRDVFLSRTLAEWKPLLDAEALTWAPVAELPEVIDDPQLEAMNAWSVIEGSEGRFRDIEHAIRHRRSGRWSSRARAQDGSAYARSVA